MNYVVRPSSGGPARAFIEMNARWATRPLRMPARGSPMEEESPKKGRKVKLGKLRTKLLALLLASALAVTGAFARARC